MDSLIKRIVAQEPNSVAQLFRLYGFDMPATPANLHNLVTVYGSQPLPFSNATGDEPKKKTFSEILEMVKNGVQTIGSIVSIAKGGTGLPTQRSGTGNFDATAGYGNEPTGATNRVLGIDRNLFIVISILIILVIVTMFFRKK